MLVPTLLKSRIFTYYTVCIVDEKKTMKNTEKPQTTLIDYEEKEDYFPDSNGEIVFEDSNGTYDDSNGEMDYDSNGETYYDRNR